jgi:hypothetical protein
VRNRVEVDFLATYAWGTWGFVNRRHRVRLFDGLLLAGVPERLPPSKLK